MPGGIDMIENLFSKMDDLASLVFFGTIIILMVCATIYAVHSVVSLFVPLT